MPATHFFSMNAFDFGPNFKWGVASSALQTEGVDHISPAEYSHWFYHLRKRKSPRIGVGTEFYRRYQQDLDWAQAMGFNHFRFSIRWPQVMPQGSSTPQQAALDYYKRLADACQARGLQLWLTLYHWDLPAYLQKRGGWRSYHTVKAFLAYAEACVNALHDRVAGWVIMNEPMVFTGAGYGIGVHAPGKRGIKSFLEAYHHAMLAQGEACRMMKAKFPDAFMGTAFSQTPVRPWHNTKADQQAAWRVSALLNRLCLDPALGFDPPVEALPFLQKLWRYFSSQAISQYAASLDFIGIQPYTRQVVKHTSFIPLLKALRVSPVKRQVPRTAIGWPYDPGVLKAACQRLLSYPELPDVYITEHGVALHDKCYPNGIKDGKRIHFFREALQGLLEVKQTGFPVKGFFVWTLTDNFEWMEGYRPRFGLVYVNFENQRRYLKASGEWFAKFLSQKSPNHASI